MAHKSKTRKVISTIVTLSSLAGLAFAGCSYLGGGSSSGGSNPPAYSESTRIQQLATVENFKYDETQSKYVWDDVLEADGYVIKINGDEFETVDNEYSFVPTTTVTEAQIKATGAYASSNWSEVYTYTVPKNEITIASINAFVNDMLPYSDLQKIVSINTKDNILYTEAVFSDGSATYFYKLEHKYEHKLESLEDAMD